jgi:hypothetical protein
MTVKLLENTRNWYFRTSGVALSAIGNAWSTEMLG